MRRLIPLVLLLIVAESRAQFFFDPALRFEVGQRLRLFENTLEEITDAKLRKGALPTLEKVTPTFFSGQLAEVGRLLDQSRLALKDKPSDDVLWAEPLYARPDTRCLDTSAEKLNIAVAAFYKVETKKPDKASVRFTLLGKSETVEVKELPLEHALSLKGLKEGDHTLKFEVLVDSKVCASWDQTISLVANLTDRIAALEKAIKEDDASLEATTARGIVAMAKSLAAKKTLETNYHIAHLLQEAESAIKTGKGFYGPDKPGKFWLVEGKDTMRLFVPKGLKKPVPLVVAMHGAGGSENLFFEGYGGGKVVKLCEERGWLLIAPRAGSFPLGASTDITRVIDALAKIYPVDTKRVFLVGHSMGASQAAATVSRNPDRYRGVAALGGGGNVKGSDALKSVPFYVGCGDRDFALAGAKTLHKRLEDAGVKKATLKIYDDVEHMAVVQLALKDVFAFFDESAK